MLLGLKRFCSLWGSVAHLFVLFFVFCCCYRGGGLGEWRGHFGRAVIWLLLSVCHPFCLQAKPTGDERLHFSPPCQSCDWLKGVRLSWLPISVCWLGVAGFCWKVQSFFFFLFFFWGGGLTRLQGCIQTLWPKTSGARQDIMKHDLMQRYHPHLWSDGLMIHSNTSDKGGDFFTTFLTCRFDHYHSYLLFFFVLFLLATADRLQWVGWNLICDNFGFTVM